MSGRRRPAAEGADDEPLSLFNDTELAPPAPRAAPDDPPSGRQAAKPSGRPARGRSLTSDARPTEPAPFRPALDTVTADDAWPTPDVGWIASQSFETGDEVPGSSATSAVAVSSLTRTVKDVLEGAFLPLWVRGEVCDFKAHRNGHWYFALRDDESQIRCVVWARDQRRIPAPPDEGMQISALGQVTVWPGRGDLQLVIRAMEATGDGLWRKALEASVARLGAEGLLAPDRKRPLPRFPNRVAVITSPDGAALHDVISVARRRAPHIEIVVVPSRVQGEGAPAELSAALDRVARWGEADVVIIGRGGGGREDLWAFNNEGLARALAACPIPTVSAVGHEVDISLCDLVADLRAATPSAAAEAVFPDTQVIRAELARRAMEMVAGVGDRLANARLHVAHLQDRLARGLERTVERRRGHLERVVARLHALSPLATLSRGYAVPRDSAGRTLSSVSDYTPGARFSLLVRDGSIEAVAESASPADQTP